MICGQFLHYSLPISSPWHSKNRANRKRFPDPMNLDIFIYLVPGMSIIQTKEVNLITLHCSQAAIELFYVFLQPACGKR